jgi:hypothetical protein
VIQPTLPKSAAGVSQPADRSQPRVKKRPAPPPTAAAPVVVAAPKVFHCHEAACAVVVPQRGQRCPAHHAAWLAFRYHAPEAADAVFTCIVPGCETRVPHREFLCAAHWARVPKDRRYKIRQFAQLYRVYLGKAIAEVAARAAEGEPADGTQDTRGLGAAAGLDGAEPSSHA